MDILLTHGYHLYSDPHELEVMRPYPPLGILYIASHLKARGFEVDVFDTTFRGVEEFGSHLRRERPPVVGIYANMMTRRNVLEMAQMAGAEGATVIVGGPDPANYPESYLARGADVVVIGEGEVTTEELLARLGRGGVDELGEVKGIVYLDGEGEPVRTEPRPYLDDLDGQPFPDRGAIDIGRYLETWRAHHGRGAVSLITARGCPYSCNWCSHAVYGYSHRRRSPQDVADEVELVLETYDPDMLWYADDVFTIHFRWFREYAEELRRRGIRIPFETITREDRLNEDIVEALAEMGAYRIWVGAESGSQRILDAMERRTDAERVSEVVGLLQRHGIEAGMFIMLGYEGEELEDLEDTVELLKRSSPDAFLTTVAYPIMGTPYYDRVADRVVSVKPWHEGSDRDHTVLGRHSRRFYRYATRWMVGEVDLHRQRRSESPDYLRMLKAYANAKVGRLGMRLTGAEVERGASAAAPVEG